MHQRLNPRKHRFRYRVFSLLFDLEELQELDRRLPLFGYNRFSLFSFNDRDHGPCDGSPLRPWIDAQLAQPGIDLQGGRVQVLCMPRVLGHTFNPISVWFCYGADEALSAVLYEVHNTFGDRHTYLVPVSAGEAGQRVLHHDAAKKLYVSPFMPVSGSYSFRLEPAGEEFSLLIRYQGEEGDRLIATHHARRTELSLVTLAQAFFKAPLVPLKVVMGPVWAITSLGGLISPVSFLFNWIIAVILFGLAAWLIQGFRLKNGLLSAVLGAVVYSVISAVVLRALGIADVDFTRAGLIGSLA